MARADGKSLVMLNGRPVEVDGNLENNASLAGKLAERGINLESAESSFSVPTRKLLAEAGVEQNQNNRQLLDSLREFGIPLSSENIRKAVAIASAIPGFDLNKVNLSTVALLLLKRLPVQSAALVKKYLSGKLSFAQILGQPDSKLSALFRQNWNLGNVLEKLQQFLTQRESAESFLTSSENEGLEEMLSSLQLQELLSEQAQGSRENRVYFQWPVFWSGQELPDTLEGEAFFQENEEDKQGFCLRMLVSPPALGQIEVAMNSLEKRLWVHFGVQPESLDSIKSIFEVIRTKLLDSDFVEVRLTAGVIRKLEGFFLEKTEPKSDLKSEKRIDLKV